MERATGQRVIGTEAEAVAWLAALVDVEKRPDWPYRRFSLAPIRALLERLGHPERAFRILHIAGSKGKGSTALFAEGILAAAGRRTGVFTSPHLERWTERFRVAGREVAGARLAQAVEALRPHVEALRAGPVDTVPTFFDVTTAAALWLFREGDVSEVVLEVGLGGRLDSTNAVDPAVTCITSIELEHTDRLGTTLAAIAAEKAGILKPGVPAVIGTLPAEARRVVLARAAELGAPLAWIGEQIALAVDGADLDGTRIRLRDGPLVVDALIPALGAHQAANAALAAAGVRRLLAEVPADVVASAAREGLARVSLPARVEVLSRAPWVIVDAAHTAASARALADVLEQLATPVDLVLSISGGKDTEAVLAALLPHARSATLTRAEATRSLDPAEIAEVARRLTPALPLRIVPNPQLALRAAKELLGPGDALCVAGSVYLAGIARRVLRAPPRPVAVTRRGPVARS